MKPTVYFRHTKTDKRFEVVKVDRETNVVTLKGEHAEFTQPYDKALFQKLGYVLEKSDG